MGFKDKIVGWLLNLAGKLGKAGDFLKQALARLEDAKIFDQVLEVAAKHVYALRVADLSNDAKRKAAFDAVLKDVELIGLKIGESLINLAIELAYNAIKSKMG